MAGCIRESSRTARLRFCSRIATGRSASGTREPLGQSLDLIVPEKQKARHWEGWARVMASGVTKYGRDALAVPATNKDGSRISIEFNIVLLRAPTGELLGAAAMVQDVTARWQQQKEMRARLAALEAKAVEAVKAG
jgi:PAS domain S-box-containing protein